MKILIVEDDQNKIKKLTEFLQKKISNSKITKKASYQSGLSEILNTEYNLIILDMTMPTYDISPHEPGGRPRVFAGREILHKMQRRKIYCPVIIVTQFETFGENRESIALTKLCEELDKKYKNYTGYVYYNITQNKWQNDFSQILEKLEIC